MIHQLTDKAIAVELTKLGDIWKNFGVLPADEKWIVPYLKYTYRSIWWSNRHGKDSWLSEEDPIEIPGSWRFLCTSKECSEASNPSTR